jgi:phage protein D
MLPMRPRIHVLANSSPVNGFFYQRLVSATIIDKSGQQSDTLTCTFENRGNTIPLPNEGDILEPFFGYYETGITTMGQFVVDGHKIYGGPSGEFLDITARSADVRENQKEKGSEHFEDTTLGDMLKVCFGRVGAQIEVDPELANIKIDYEARFDQSTLDLRPD